MSYELILCEKPQAALKIATALADTKPVKKLNKKVPYYELTHKKKKIVVACAVGHLYTVSEKEKSGWTYPVLEMEWKPTTEVNKNASYITDYLLTIKKLTKDANEFTVATDYDIEGEVIGLNVIRFVCNQKDAKRMKFSTLTDEELNYSYEHASKHLDWPQAEAGETRHFLDWLWGINSSRALTNSIKAAGRGFKVLSTGRIQGPTLKIIVDKELEIKAFKPIPFWQIELKASTNKSEIVAWHEKDKFWEKQEADRVMKVTKGKKAFIKSITKKQFSQPPPNPFDLTALQIEAYKCFKIAPKNTLELTQDLYIAGLISYPRTSSNQLPPSIDYKKVLSKLAEQKNYSSLAKELLKKPLRPNNGIKKDPAHPAVYPTGEIPKDLKGDHLKMYDLIVKRTLATFAEPATRENMTVVIDVNKENFIAVGIKTLKLGWHEFYKPYSKLKEEELPELKEGQELKVKKITLLEKETQPPKRFTQASIIKELERKNLGTKSTRALIVDSLYQRNYVKEKAIEATVLGIKTVEILEKYCPEIVDEALTRHFEEEMESIRDKSKKGETILKEAKTVLTKIFKHFKKNEVNIGKGLADANRETQNELNIVGKCPNCKDGELRILYSRKTKSSFIACNKYPKCKTTFSLPQNALIKTTKETCKECNSPLVLVIRRGKRPWKYCIGKNCPAKQRWLEEQAKNNN